MAGAGAALPRGLDGHRHGGQGAGRVGHRRRPRPQQRVRRHPVPAQHRAGRGAQPEADGGNRRGHRESHARQRHRLGLRPDPGRGARRPLGTHLRELFRASGHREKLCRRLCARHAGHAEGRCQHHRHRQALHRRRRHRVRQGPRRQQVQQIADDQHPRRRLLSGAGSGRADRHVLVQFLERRGGRHQLRQDARQPRHAHRRAEDKDGLRRLRHHRLERPRRSAGLPQRQLRGRDQCRQRHDHGAGRLEGLYRQHHQAGGKRRDPDGAYRRCREPHHPRQAARRPVRQEPGAERLRRQGRSHAAARAGAPRGARVAGAAQERPTCAADRTRQEDPGGRQDRGRHVEPERRLVDHLAGHGQHQCRLPEWRHGIGRHSRGGRQGQCHLQRGRQGR